MRSFLLGALSALRPKSKKTRRPAPRYGLRLEPLEERNLMAVLSIAAENQLAGTPESQWNVSAIMSDNIEGFTNDVSYNQGSAVQFKINTDASSYRVEIYRMGYYGGDGARLITTLDSLHGTVQPAALVDAATGMFDCGNWSVSATWTVPTDATSGIYFADFIRTDGVTGASQTAFIVRNDTSQSEFLFQASVSAWEAYNAWGGNSLYTDNNGVLAAGRAYAVSYNRPYAGGLQVYSWEYPMVRFMESNGFDVTYSTDVDSDRYGSLLKNHETFLSVGHDEYWSGAQRANVEAARDAGVNLAFFSGNDVYWKVRYAASIDASATSYRTMICYKESLANAKIDPDASVWTGTWRDPSYSAQSDGGNPENALTGTLFTSIYTGAPGTSLTVSAADGKLRFWRNTDVAALAPGQTAVLGDYVIGYEINEDVDNGFRPAGLMDLTSTKIDVPLKLNDQANGYVPGTAVHSMTMYRASSGALVFSAGTIQLSWGLDSHHDGAATTPDLSIMQAIINLFADMGAQPATLQAGLVASIATTDFTAPTATITSLVNGASVAANGSVLISGTAHDNGGGIVAGVEVSVDGGDTWRKATGRENWSYLWTPSTQGGYYILVRTVDDSGNLETPGPGVSVTAVAATTQTSVWNDSFVPAVASNPDHGAIEVGTKFTSTVAGFVTGIRFYKGAQGAGLHVGHLWSATGTLLATVNFTTETASGWQTAIFSSPVAIQANTTYVISYFAPLGNYAVTNSYFASGAAINGTMKATAGVFGYGSGVFPTSTYQSSNYWVDAIVATTGVTLSPQTDARNVATTAVVSATFSAAMTASSINTNTFQLLDATGVVVPATITYNATTRVAKLKPTNPLLNGMSYTAVVHGQTGGMKISGGVAMGRDVVWSFTTAAAPIGPEQTLWEGEVPTIVDSGEVAPVELGMRFQTDVAAYVTGVRFYKAAANTGLHTGSLWTDAGVLLAAVNFTSETASGWQQADFVTPVEIQANTTYVISYFAPAGHYSITVSGLSTPTTEGPITALGSDTAPNGLFVYTTDSFPTESYQSSNYWVAPVVVGNLVAHITPASGDTTFPADAPIDIQFSRDVNIASITTDTIQLFVSTRCGMGACATCMCSRAVLVPSSVSYDAATDIATLIPNVPLIATGSYTVVIRGRSGGVIDVDGNALATDVYSTFTAATPAVSHKSAFEEISPQILDSGDASALELGMKFRTSVNGFVTGVKFYKSDLNTGTHVGSLWSSAGQLLATVTFTGESANGWQQASFSQPVAIQSNTDYIISYFAPNGHYSIDVGGFTNTITSGDLTVPGGANGLFNYGSSAFPTGTYLSSNYWVDALFVASPVASVLPENGAQLVPTTPSVQITFNRAMDQTTVNGATIRLQDANGAFIAATVTYDAQTNVATLAPVAALNGNATYTVSIWGGVMGIRDAAGNGMPANLTSIFTTASSGNYSLWNSATVPPLADGGDTATVQLGVKFRSSEAGYVDGVRFYKSAANTGTHVGYLWSSTGTLLAQVTFTNETASGWQQANFSTPVLIQANSTYVVSYLAPQGHYSSSVGYFATTGAQNNMLTAPATGVDGANGVYLYGSSGAFPTNSYQSSNYWVDVVFSPALVSSIQPAASATGVALNSSILVTFSTAMNAASISSSTILLKTAAGASVPATVSYNASNLVATLTPSSPLAYGTSYTVTVVSGAVGIKNSAGSVMPVDVTSTFMTLNPPTVSSVTPSAGTTNVSINATMSVVFAQAMDATSITTSTVRLLNSGGVAVPATVSYNATTRTATITPNTVLTNNASYSILVVSGAAGARDTSGNALAADVSAAFTTIAAGGASYSVWSNGAIPNIIDSGETSAVQLGAKFRATTDGFVTGVKFYKSAANTGTHVGYLWSSTGTLLAQVTFTGESASGWQQATFSTPVYIKANTTYVISYLAPNGHYSIDVSYFATSGTQNGPLTELAQGVDGSNGVYLYGTTAGLPTGSYSSSNYWVDVVYSKSLVSSISPADTSTNVAVSASISVAFNTTMNASTINTTTVKLVDGSGATIAATVTYNASTQTATLTPTVALANGTTYSVVIASGTSGVRDTLGGTLAANVNASFTTVAAASASYSVWNSSATPSTVDSGDTAAVQLGAKFRATTDGFVTGVKFYKSAANTGTHVGYLWSSTGTLLAQVTFTGETASGWQQATFSTPVYIKANTTYIVSYLAPKGHYSVDVSYFAAGGAQNGPLTELAQGVDGSNGVYRYGTTAAVPNGSYSSSNYWVDVVYVKSLISSVTPAAAATAVSRSTTISIAFAAAMNAASLSAANVQLFDASGKVVATNMTYNSATKTLVVTPTVTLAASTTYTIRVKGGASGVQDAAGNLLFADFVSTFKTGRN